MLYKKVIGILCLIQKQTLSSPSDLKSQKVMEITQVFKFKSLAKLLHQNIKKLGIVPSEDNVIHINKEIDQEFAMSKNEERGVSKGSLKSQVN